MREELFSEIIGNPDDDGLRLVYADAIGGERGELIVIQCELARGELTKEQETARRERERELLEKYATEWAGSIPKHARRWSFRRGFVEAARFVETYEAHDWPLLRSMSFDRWNTSHLKIGADTLLALDIGDFAPEPLLPALPNLRAFACTSLDDESSEEIIRTVSNAPIEQLRLPDHRLEPTVLDQLLAAAPKLVALEVTTLTDPVVHRPLRALRVSALDDDSLYLLGTSPISETLEHLAFTYAGDPATLPKYLAAFPKLHVVDLWPETTLVHHDPMAMITLGKPWFEWSLPATLTSERGDVYELPVRPGDEPTHLGRGLDADVRVFSSRIARRHMRFTWRGGAHEIQDLASTNGIILNGVKVDRARLADGDELVLGDVTMTYRIVQSVGGT